jgi:hypothetical protein
VADSRRLDLDEDFTGLGTFQIEFDDLKRLLCLERNGGASLHDHPPWKIFLIRPALFVFVGVPRPTADAGFALTASRARFFWMLSALGVARLSLCGNQDGTNQAGFLEHCTLGRNVKARELAPPPIDGTLVQVAVQQNRPTAKMIRRRYTALLIVRQGTVSIRASAVRCAGSPMPVCFRDPTTTFYVDQ